MASVEVRLYATLRNYSDGTASVRLEVTSPTTVADVLNQMDVPLDHARLVFVDHRGATLDTPLNGGEQVSVFPAIGGG